MTKETKAANATEETAETPRVVEVARQTMVGDIRDVVLNMMKDKKLTGKAWSDMKEDEQKDVNRRIVACVEEAVVRAIDIIHSDGEKHVKAILKKVTVNDGYQGVFEFPDHENLRHEVADAQGDTILIVLTNSDQYLGEREKVKFDKDQPELPVEDAEQTGETNADDDKEK